MYEKYLRGRGGEGLGSDDSAWGESGIYERERINLGCISTPRSFIPGVASSSSPAAAALRLADRPVTPPGSPPEAGARGRTPQTQHWARAGGAPGGGEGRSWICSVTMTHAPMMQLLNPPPPWGCSHPDPHPFHTPCHTCSMMDPTCSRSAAMMQLLNPPPPWRLFTSPRRSSGVTLGDEGREEGRMRDVLGER